MSDIYFWLSEAQFARLEPLLPTDTRGKPSVFIFFPHIHRPAHDDQGIIAGKIRRYRSPSSS
jgi:hypothetical protein